MLMNDKPNDKLDDLDERPLEAVHVQEIIKVLDALRAYAKAHNMETSHAAYLRRIDYVEGVILYANSSGRDEQYMTLPVPFTVPDIESVLGKPEEVESGSSAAWHAHRRKFDASAAGRSLGGRSR